MIPLELPKASIKSILYDFYKWYIYGWKSLSADKTGYKLEYVQSEHILLCFSPGDSRLYRIQKYLFLKICSVWPTTITKMRASCCGLARESWELICAMQMLHYYIIFFYMCKWRHIIFNHIAVLFIKIILYTVLPKVTKL